MTRRQRSFLPVLALAAVCSWANPANASEADEWHPAVIARFGNIDAIDAEDGPLAVFLKGIRNDGRFIPPMRALVGPEIRNPTFYGLTYGAWVEAAVLVPPRPGPAAALWVFPVDNRDEYLVQLANQGLSEYEGMDGVTVLREMSPDGNVTTWHLEWLPGNVAVFGLDREAVAAARLIYAENSAARGMLSASGGAFVEPDATVRVHPHRLAAWQDREAGVYWWREKVERLTRDIIDHWRPNPARERLISALSEELAAFPRTLERVDLNLWFEENGVEWRVDVAGDGIAKSELSQLDSFRRLPGRMALGYAMPVTERSLSRLGETMGQLLLGGAGGVVTNEARDAVLALYATLERIRPAQMAAAWIPPPAGRPELGGTRMLVLECERPDIWGEFWSLLREAVKPGTPVAQAFSQLGWQVEITPQIGDESAAEAIIRPAGPDGAEPYYQAVFAVRQNGNWLALVGGESRVDAEDRRQTVAYRAGLARDAVIPGVEGGPEIRNAFTRMGPRGTSFLGLFEPVRFCQLALVEMADWSPRSPDQHEPLSTQLAREFLEYAAGGPWSASGEADAGVWRFSGGMDWQSLSRLSGALGITEAIGME